MTNFYTNYKPFPVLVTPSHKHFGTLPFSYKSRFCDLFLSPDSKIKCKGLKLCLSDTLGPYQS